MNAVESEILLKRIINETVKLEELTQEELVFSISKLAKLYKGLIANSSKITYNNEFQSVTNELNICKLKIEESNLKIKNLTGKLSKPLTLSERLKGRLDLKKMTSSS